jgi:sodium/potassium-transporting ATPase subunit alpha
LIRIAYGLHGILETIGGFFTYFVIFMQCGFFPMDLLFVRARWDSKGVNDFEDSFGQEWVS